MSRLAFWLAGLFFCLFAVASYADNCSSWRSPQKVWLNEYFFGSGGSAPPNFLEIYSTANSFPASWQNWSIDVYSAANTKTTYPFTNATATACSVVSKTWLTAAVPAGLRQQNALVILKDNEGKYVDAFVFDNSSPPAPWPGAAASSWFPGLADSTSGCPALATALQTQAGNSSTTAKQANMLVLPSYGNKDMARDPDGGSKWDLTSNTGTGTTYTQCVSNNTNFTKTVDNATPTPGSTVTFTLNLANTGSSSLSGVQITDFLPPALTYISATPTNVSDPAVTTGTYSTTDPNTGAAATATTVSWAPAAVAAGTTSKLHIKMQVPSDATVGYSYTNTAQTTAGLISNQTDFANITIGSPNTPSFAITVSPTSSTTCTSALRGPKVVITAMSAANGSGTPLTSYNGTATLTASSPNPKWYTSSGTALSGNTVTFVNGTATLYLTDTVAETFTVSAIDATTFSPNVMQGSSGSITFSSDSVGLALTDADVVSPGYGAVAARPHAVKATLSNCGITASTVSGTYSGTIYYLPGLNHPTGADAPTISTSASCPGSVAPTLSASGTPISLNVVAGVSTFYLCTTDVGQYALSLTLNNVPKGNGTTSVTGVSPDFTVRPFVITASGFLNDASNGPGAGTNAFTAAGKSFTGSFKAWRWLASADVGNDGLPDTGVTAATITNANPGLTTRFSGTTNNAGVVALAPIKVTPSGGVLGSLSPTTLTLTSGSIGSNQLSYNEVGSIRIGGGDATGTYAVTNYLGASSVNVPLLSDDVIGRFIPDHFALSAPSLATRADLTACTNSSFTYMDEPFQIQFTLTAQNASNATTQNYQGSLAFLNPTSASWTSTGLGTAGSFGLGAINGTENLSTRLSLSGTASETGWVNGSNTITANVKLTRATTSGLPTGPYEALRIGVAPQDTDNVKTTGLSLDADSSGTAERVLLNAAGTSVRFGRLKLFNAFGSASSSLSVPVQAQYWTGKSWLLNSADSCTPIPATAVAKSGYVNHQGVTTTAWTVSAGTVSNLVNGQGSIVLSKTPAAGTGSVNVCVDLGTDPAGGVSCAATSAAMSYLQGKWAPGTSFDNDPSARATFGVYSPETKKTIHVRELF